METLAAFVFFFFILGVMTGMCVLYLVAAMFYEKRQGNKQGFKA